MKLPFCRKMRQSGGSVSGLIDELRRGFRSRTNTACPDSPIEYRRLAAEKGIVIEVEKYANDYVAYRLKRNIYEQMEKEIRKCEERYR